MHSYKTYLHPHVHEMPLNFMAFPAFKNKIIASTQRPAINKEIGKKYRPALRLASSEKGLPSLFSQELLPSKKILGRDPQTQAEHCIALMEDPLWKRICAEFLAMMGALSLLKIRNTKLGPLEDQYEIIHIDCKTEEESEFVQKYAFVILGILQTYFPHVKSLIIRIKR